MRHCRYNRFIVYFALIALVFCFALPEARAQLPFYSDFGERHVRKPARLVCRQRYLGHRHANKHERA